MKKIIFLIVLFFFIAPLYTATLYVDRSNPLCSDTTNYANNSAESPWCSLDRAVFGSTNRSEPNSNQAARAGDRVVVVAGRYITLSAGQGNKFPYYNPVNSGSLGSSITFQANGTVMLEFPSGSGGMIGAYNRNYIIWDGFTITEATAPSVRDTGPVVLWSTTGSQVLNCIINGNGTVAIADNHNGIRLEQTNSVVIRNNKIYNVYGNTTTTHNGAGIMLYDSAGTIIENNWIYECGAGIYVKGDHAADGWPQENITIRKNWINSCVKGVFLYAGSGTIILQNIFKGNNMSVRFYGSPEINSSAVVNNTFISTNIAHDNGYSAYGNMTGVTDIKLWNNIFYGSFSEGLSMGELNSIGEQSFEHNLYYNYDTFGSINSTQISFAIWTNTYNQDSTYPAGISGSNPLFVNASGDNYKLEAISPAASIGRTIMVVHESNGETIPAGAYITGSERIGIDNDYNVEDPPHSISAPSGLRIEFSSI